jgi:transposase
MFHVGLDIHTKRISICALDEKGQVVHRSQVRSIQDLVRVLSELPDPFVVCYEARCGYGHFHDLLRPLAARVLVAHPGQLRLIFRSKNKNDRKDAERLAKLLYLGETPTVHVPSLDVRTWRELINCRSQVIAKRTRAKNALRALLRGAGVVPPKSPGLWTKKGLAWLPACGPRRAWPGSASSSCPRPRSSCAGTCCSKRSSRSTARCGASSRS